MTTDLLELTAEFVDIASESFHEQELVAYLEAALSGVPWLTVDRVGDNLVARTQLGRPHRLILGGHTDTVPANGNERARIEGDRLHGLGSTDMKGGLAIMFDLALRVNEPAVDVTYLFYAREEVANVHNGLHEIEAAAPHLLEGDVALLGEPTLAVIEAGCQGTMRFRVTMRGERAHTARAWMGRNAIHRAGPLLAALEAYEPRQPVLQGCSFHEALQAVDITGGVAGNVVPDEVTLLINHRFAPDRTADEAEAHARSVIEPYLADGDLIEVVDIGNAAAPHLDHPVLAALIGRHDLAVKAKLGWTDVAFFAARGVPAANFGPGDATIAHTAGEYLDRNVLEATHYVLADLLTSGV